jgi:hypothetical protein
VFNRIRAQLTSAGPPEPLAFFRILVASFCLAKIAATGTHFLDVFGPDGFVESWVAHWYLGAGIPSMEDFVASAAKIGISAKQTVLLMLAAYVVFLFALLVGFLTRAAAIGSWAMHFFFLHAGYGLAYGMDFFTHIALFYCVIMPCGDCWSMDARRRPERRHWSVQAGVTRRMLKLQLCIIYTSSGIAKAAGPQWWTGESIWRSMVMPTFTQVDVSWLAHHTWFPAMLGVSVILLEVGYGVYTWLPSLRSLWVLSVCLMHLGIAIFLGMYLFGAIMIILNVGAFGYELARDARKLFGPVESEAPV